MDYNRTYEAKYDFFYFFILIDVHVVLFWITFIKHT